MIDGVGVDVDKCIDVDVAKVFDLLGEEKLPCTLRSDSNGNMQVSSMIHVGDLQ